MTGVGNEPVQIAQARLAAIIESSDDAIISKDLNGIITSWNQGAQKIFGYTADEVIGRPVTILMPHDRVNEEPGILARIRSGTRVDHYETVRQRKDGTLIDISLSVSPIFDEGGRVVGASKIARDITSSREVRQARADAETLRRIVGAQEAERKRIARDLHDHVGQEMTALRLQLQAALEKFRDQRDVVAAIEELRQTAERVDWDIGFLAWELRPTEIEELGLADALSSFISEWSRQHSVNGSFVCELRTELSRHLGTNLYRIVQEALNNVAKHAEARTVSLVLGQRSLHEITLVIEDDGIGFSQHEKERDRGYSGFGLVGMRERAALFDGSLEIESSPGVGTTLYFRFPLERAAETPTFKDLFVGGDLETV